MSKNLDKESHAAELAKVEPERRQEVVEKATEAGGGDRRKSERPPGPDRSRDGL